MRAFDTFCSAGETGLGKTTFIENLTSSFKLAIAGPPNDGAATSMQQFSSNPTSLRTVLEPMDISECSRRLYIAIQVLPTPVLNCVTACRWSTLDDLQSPAASAVLWLQQC